MTEGIDYAWAHPAPAVLAAAGKRFACRYLSFDPTKNLTAVEAQQLHAAGIATVSNWESTAGAAKLGFGQGANAATTAAAQHAAAGGPADRPIYFSVDFDVPDYAPGSADPVAKLGPIAEYFRGVASVIGLARTGAYGGYWAISRLFDAGLIRWGWQTFAWSAGRWDARAHIQQYSNGVTVGGADCDLDRATVGDYGQWGAGMEQSDPVLGNKARTTVGNVLADGGNFRDWWYLAPGADGNNPPPPGSRADLLFKAVQHVLAAAPPAPAPIVLTDADREDIAARVVAQLGALRFEAAPPAAG
jgi:hypothetical protein